MTADAPQSPSDLIRQAREAVKSGRPAAGRELQARAVELLRRGADPAALAHAVRHLADLDDRLDRPEAEAGYAEALAIYGALPHPPALDFANAVRAAAAHAERKGRPEDARRLWSDARKRYAELGAVFESLLGRPGNPGLEEADARLKRLAG